MKNKFIAVLSAAGLLACALLLGGCGALSRLLNGSGGLFDSEIPSTKPDTLERVNISERTFSFSGYGFDSIDEERLGSLYSDFDKYVNLSYSDEFSVDSDFTLKDVEEVLYAYRNDHPEVFWLSDTNDFSYYYSGGDLVIKLTFIMEGGELIEAKSALNRAVERMVSDAPDNATDYEIELYLNNSLVDEVNYDENGECANRHNAYGALIEKSAVCDGYSKAFQLLCNRRGIDCIAVDGIANDFRESTGGHMWNCVKLDDNWYHIDVTWNDAESDVYSLRYCYLNLTTEQISQDHEIGKLFSEITDDEYSGEELFNNFVPYCNSSEYNYFMRECLVLDDMDRGDQIIYAMANAAASGKPSFDFIIDDALDFENTLHSLAQDGYLYEWVDRANSINGNNHVISHDSKIFGIGERRVVTMNIEYK